MDAVKYIRRRAVCARYGISGSSLYARMSKGLFPKPDHLGPRTVAWEVAKLDAWDRARHEQSGAGV